MSFLAFIFLLILVVVVILPMIIVQRVLHGWRRFRNGGVDPQEQAYRRAYYNNSPPHHEPQQRKKVFDKSDGEYVEFEEISVTKTATSSENGDIYYEREEQVTDAEWTEIK